MDVYTKSYRSTKWQEFQFKEFWDFQFENLEKNDIWVQPSWLITHNTIRGKVMAYPKSWSWWVLWVHLCTWLVYAPKVFQLCINQLVVWFVQVHMKNWPTFYASYSPSRSSNTSFLPLKCCKLKNVPQFFFLSLFSHLDSHFKPWVFQGVWGCITQPS